MKTTKLLDSMNILDKKQFHKATTLKKHALDLSYLRSNKSLCRQTFNDFFVISEGNTDVTCKKCKKILRYKNVK